MKPELEKRLLNRYPVLLRRRVGGKRSVYDHWGIECGDGWYAILDAAFAKLADMLPRIHILQIKEKFGTLRIYVEPVSPETDLIVDRAADTSRTTCEVCGAPGIKRTVGVGYVKTVCDAHATMKRPTKRKP